MALKLGYKQSEVGEIPEEWEVRRVGDLGTVVRGGSPRPAGDPKYFNGSYIPWLTVAALTNISDSQIYVCDTVSCLTEEGSRHSRTLLDGTVIIANSGATLGVAKILNVTCCANDGIAAIIKQKLGDKRFVCYFINTRTSHLREVVATGNGQPNLNTGLIREIVIPFPSPIEQCSIADALSDMDSLINALNQLIAKKRNVKQAAMQELLTGQTRLPGFSGEWAEFSFDDLFAILRNASNSRADLVIEGDIGYLHYGDIHNHQLPFFDCESDLRTFLRADRVRTTPSMADGDLVMVDASEDTEAIGKAVEIRGLIGRCAVAGLHTLLLRPKGTRLADGFKGYLQFLPAVRKSLVRMATGVSVYGITRSNVRTILVTIPNADEQRAIAAVLADMESEIAVLEGRLSKTRDLKQGMIQELLTGRTRLA